MRTTNIFHRLQFYCLTQVDIIPLLDSFASHTQLELTKK